MKTVRGMLVGALALGIQLASAQAAVQNSVALRFDGTQTQENIALQDAITHTIYEDRRELYSCIQNEFAGYRRVCRMENRYSCRTEKVCRNIPDQVCQTKPNGEKTCKDITRRECRMERACGHYPEEVCSREPYYEPVVRTCERWNRVAVGEETDYIVNARVQVRFGQAPAGIRADEDLRIDLRGADLSIRAVRPSNRLVILVNKRETIQTIREKGAGAGEKQIDTLYDVSFADAQAARLPLARGMKDLQVSNNRLTFTVGRIEIPELLHARLEIMREKSLSKDEYIYRGDLAADHTQFIDMGDHTQVSVNLSALSMKRELRGGKFNFHVFMTVKDSQGATVINPQTLKALGGETVKHQGSLKL